MKIGIVLFNMPISKPSGSCRFVWEIAKNLQSAGQDITVIANKEDNKLTPNFRLLEVDSPPYGSWSNCLNNKVSFSETIFKYVLTTLKAHDNYQFDLLHVQHLLFSTFIASIIKNVCGLPFIATCHGTETYESLNKPDMINFFKFANEAELLTAASESIVDDINRLTKFSKKNIPITYPGVDTDKFKPNNKKRNEIRLKLGFLEKDKVLIFAGRLVNEKGILSLPKIFKEITIKNSNVKLLIVGDGPERKNTEKLLNNNSIDPNLYRFTGFIPQQEMPGYYNASDIFLMPTIWNEPFATCALEAISSGCLPIVNNIGGIAKMLKKEGFEKLVHNEGKKSFAEKTIDIIENKEIFSKMVPELILLVKNKFSWEKRTKQLVHLYEEAIIK